MAELAKLHEETPAVTKIRATMVRHRLDNAAMAAYLGVPTTTLINWLGLQRRPPAVVDRLMDVLGYIEAVGGGLHDSLLPKGR